MLEGTHDGFAYLPGKPSHIRQFEVTRDSVTIHDRIEGQSDQQAAITFLLHPAREVAVPIGKLASRRMALRLSSTAPFLSRLSPQSGGPTRVSSSIPIACVPSLRQGREKLSPYFARGGRRECGVFEDGLLAGKRPEQAARNKLYLRARRLQMRRPARMGSRQFMARH
jgi:hypothetical protein